MTDEAPDTNENGKTDEPKFKTQADAEYTPFLNPGVIKFIRLSRETIQQLGLSESLGTDNDDIILFSEPFQDHWEILNNNFGLSREQARNIKCKDAGILEMISTPEEEIKRVLLLGASGELIDEKGRDLARLYREKPDEVNRLHASTAALLNKVYAHNINFVSIGNKDNQETGTSTPKD